MSPAEREQLIDLVLELQHDLGKYLRLPVAMLPAESGPEDLRAAVVEAVYRTRRGPRGERGAQEIWHDLGAESAGGLDAFGAWERVGRAVEQALGLGAQARSGAPLPSREDALAQLSEVASASAELLAEVRDAP